MLKIKLFRYGKNNQAHYRIVVAERRSKRGGQYIDLLGTYTPDAEPSLITLDQAKYTNWIKKGAQPTATVSALAVKASSSVNANKSAQKTS
jgi:small subunit ribosomal protein S16